MGLFGKRIRTDDPFFGSTEVDEVIVRQWVEHTLSTRRGAVRSAPDHGFDVRAELAAASTPARRAAIPTQVKAALQRGKKIARATVSAEERQLGGGRVGLRLHIEIVPATGGNPFAFTYDVEPG